MSSVRSKPGELISHPGTEEGYSLGQDSKVFREKGWGLWPPHLSSPLACLRRAASILSSAGMARQTWDTQERSQELRQGPGPAHCRSRGTVRGAMAQSAFSPAVMLRGVLWEVRNQTLAFMEKTTTGTVLAPLVYLGQSLVNVRKNNEDVVTLHWRKLRQRGKVLHQVTQNLNPRRRLGQGNLPCQFS